MTTESNDDFEKFRNEVHRVLGDIFEIHEDDCRLPWLRIALPDGQQFYVLLYEKPMPPIGVLDLLEGATT